MNELARLGVAMDSKQLKDGKAALDALVPSAQKAEKGIERFNAAAHGLKTVTGGAASGVDKVRAAAAAAVGATDRFGKAALGAGTAMKTVQIAAVGAAAPINNLVGGLTRVSTATGMADAHIKAYKASLASVPAAANSAASSLQRLGASANDNINRLQATPGNIAAQFQDIGVTAAGGMNPLLIALQQGTQLSAAMQGGVGNLIAGLRQLFNMTTILTVGFVALIAAGLQAVDWMRVAEVLVNNVADGLDGLAGFVEGASEALIGLSIVAGIAFGPRILASVFALGTTILHSLVTAISTATLAMISFSLANPFTALVLAIGVVITAMALLNDTFGGVFTGILRTVKYVANAIIRGFLTAFNAVMTAGEVLVNGLISGFNRVSKFFGFEAVGNVDLSGFKADLAQGRDFVGEIGTGIGNAMRGAGDMLRGIDFSDPEKKKKDRAGRSPRERMSEAERQQRAYEELTRRAQERINSLTDETMALGMTEAAGARFLAQQELLRDAARQGITLDAARRKELMLLGDAMASAQIDKAVAEQTRAYQEQMRELKQQSELIGLTGAALTEAATFQRLLNDAVQAGKIDLSNMNEEMRKHILLLRERAGNIAAQSEANRNAEFTADFTRNLELQTAAMERSRGEIGLVGAALAAYRIESDLLNRAARENIELTPEYLEGIQQQAARFGELTEQVRLQQQRFDDARESLRGFFGDMVSGLQQGQSVWQTFGNAVMNVVNRIIDRLLTLATDDILGSLTRLLGVASPKASLLGSVNSTIDANPGLFAKGGAFDGGVQMFAKGGAFTNGIYSDPTLFKFAKGGAFGMMGEAGPEAVMPLKRGPDGSLGVRVNAMEPQQVVVRVVTDDERFDAYVDTRIDANAPVIAQAGSEIGQRETRFKNSRRLA